MGDRVGIMKKASRGSSKRPKSKDKSQKEKKGMESKVVHETPKLERSSQSFRLKPSSSLLDPVEEPKRSRSMDQVGIMKKANRGSSKRLKSKEKSQKEKKR